MDPMGLLNITPCNTPLSIFPNLNSNRILEANVFSQSFFATKKLQGVEKNPTQILFLEVRINVALDRQGNLFLHFFTGSDFPLGHLVTSHIVIPLYLTEKESKRMRWLIPREPFGHPRMAHQIVGSGSSMSHLSAARALVNHDTASHSATNHKSLAHGSPWVQHKRLVFRTNSAYKRKLCCAPDVKKAPMCLFEPYLGLVQKTCFTNHMYIHTSNIIQWLNRHGIWFWWLSCSSCK